MLARRDTALVNVAEGRAQRLKVPPRSAVPPGVPTSSPTDELTTAELAAVAELGIDPDQLRASLAPKAPRPRGWRVPRSTSARASVAVAAVLMVLAGFHLASHAAQLASLDRQVQRAHRDVAEAEARRAHAAEAVGEAPFDAERALYLAQSERRLEAAAARLAETEEAYGDAVAGPVGRFLASSRGLPAGR